LAGIGLYSRSDALEKRMKKLSHAKEKPARSGGKGGRMDLRMNLFDAGVGAVQGLTCPPDGGLAGH